VNGFGKSSIYEALSYAIRGSVQKLDELQAAEHPDDYYSNKFHGTGKSTIALEFESDDSSPQIVRILVERTSAGKRVVTSPTAQPDPEGFLKALDQPFTLLDYRTFSQFIEDSPLTRGRSFAALLGMNEYAQLVQALHYVANAKVVNSDLEITSSESKIAGLEKGAESSLSRVAKSYQSLTGKPLADSSDLASKAIEIVKALEGVPLLETHFKGAVLSEINLDEVTATLRAAEHGDERSELSRSIQLIESLEAIGDPSDTQPTLVRAELATFAEKIVEIGDLFLTTRGSECRHLYVEFSEFLGSGSWENEFQCPLCDSALSESISTIVTRQVALYEEVDKKIGELKDLWEGSLLATRLASLEGSPVLLAEYQPLASDLSTKSKLGTVTSTDIESAFTQMTLIEESRATLLTDSRAKKTELEASLPPSLVKLTEQVEAARTFVSAVSDIETSTQVVSALKARLALSHRWVKLVNNMHDSFSEAVANATQTKINDIDTSFKEMFKNLMNAGDVIPDLRRDSGESLNVVLQDFHGLSNLSARALLSESQRNALAISVYLTAAMHHASASRFVVLDDITSSFDAGHQLLLMEYIRTKMQYGSNGDGVQFLILSHDGHLEKYFDRVTETHEWRHHKLLGLAPTGMIFVDLQNGQRIRDSATDFLDSGQVDQALRFMRQYLEFKLMQIIRAAKIPVSLDFAMKDHTRMVSNCVDAITDAVDIANRAGVLVLSAQQLSDLNSIHVPAIVGNWTAHYETSVATSLSPAVLKSVLGTIDDFSECFKCDVVENGATVRKYYKSIRSA
jgi:DNA repair exonuclease SbcCD ATPase subunit